MTTLRSTLLLLSLLPAGLVAQREPPRTRVTAASCPAADSVFGVAQAKQPVLQGIESSDGLRLGYPVKPTLGAYGTISPRLEMAAYPAPAADRVRPAELLITLSGDPAKKLRDMSQPLQATLTLKDDTTVTILGTFPPVTGAPAAGMAIAFVSFPFSGSELARIARAKDAKLELLGQKVSLSKELRQDGAEGYRAVLCGYIR